VDEITQFLKGPYTARLACIRPDGRPHVIPVWQEWDGHDFFVIAWRGSQWADYVQENPNVSLTVDEPWIPLRRVVVSGCIQPHDGSPAELSRLLQRMTRRYLGRPAAPGMADQVQGAFRIHPEGLRGWQGLFQVGK
jgi:nitroimidazol reductase NimA-like FMN-containing flavoprotein (pyridoxamine 5'-phosphate oxidase superfamily)